MQKRRESNAATKVAVFAIELLVIVFSLLVLHEFQRPILQAGQIGLVTKRLPRCRCLSGAQQIAPPQLDRINPQSGGDDVHVPLDREDRLRRAESPKRPIRRRIAQPRLAMSMYILAIIWTGCMNAPAPSTKFP